MGVEENEPLGTFQSKHRQKMQDCGIKFLSPLPLIKKIFPALTMLPLLNLLPQIPNFKC